MSIVLAVYEAAGVRFGTVTVLGNTVTLTRPELLPIGLWLLWAYTVLRYYQLYHDLADTGPLGAHNQRLNQVVIRRGRKSLIATLSDAYLAPYHRDDFTFGFSEESVNISDTGWRVQANVMSKLRSGDKTLILRSLTAAVPAPSRMERLRAWGYVALHTRYFTEYQLPLLIASAPLIVWVVFRIL